MEVGRDREPEVGLFKELFPGSASREGETHHSPNAGLGDSPSRGTPVASPAQSSVAQAEVCGICGAFVHGGGTPIATGICGPCERDARGGFLTRSEQEQLSAIADAADEDQRQADAKRRKELPESLAGTLALVAEQLRQILLANGLSLPHQAPTPWAAIAQAERVLEQAAEMGVARA